MNKNKTTNQVLGDMIRKFAHEQKEESENFQKSLNFIREVCDAGLVDDVEPTHPRQHNKEPNPVVCLVCGNLITSEELLCVCVSL